MKIKKTLVQFYVAWKETLHNLKIEDNKQFKQTHLEADIIRYAHGVEKGLSLESPRLEFGYTKILYLFDLF